MQVYAYFQGTSIERDVTVNIVIVPCCSTHLRGIMHAGN